MNSQLSEFSNLLVEISKLEFSKEFWDNLPVEFIFWLDLNHREILECCWEWYDELCIQEEQKTKGVINTLINSLLTFTDQELNSIYYDLDLSFQ